MTEVSSQAASETLPGAAAPDISHNDTPLASPGNSEQELHDDSGHHRRSLELLHGVEMTVTVEFGRTRVLMKDLLGLHAGSVLELDRPVGSPVDVVVNGVVLARGDLVVVDDDELGVRISEITGRDGKT